MREHLQEVVERALQRELSARRNLRPHAQLGIAPDATAAEIDKAYARLRGRYETISLAEYGPVTVEAANAIAELLRAAHEAMRSRAAGGERVEALRPLEPRMRGDETCRALQTLRAAIERRLAEADENRRSGRVTEAIRGFESVLLLDRNNQVARESLRELRATARPRRANAFVRLFSRVFKRPSVIDADSSVSGA